MGDDLEGVMPAVATDIRRSAAAFLRTGLCVLPAVREGDDKRVALPAWKPFQRRLPTDEELGAWLDGSANSICLVCGAVSGNLEMIDFDLGGEAFGPWRALVESSAPGLLDRLVVETTPSGGRHVVYRSVAAVSGNCKLAQRRIDVDGPDDATIGGKRFRPRRDASGGWHVVVTAIETRGEGGLFLCAPSPGYEIVQGDLAAPPILAEDEREILLRCAWELHELPVPVLDGPPRGGDDAATSLRPGDDFNRRGDVREALVRHGWTLARTGPNEHWRRPGKATGWSATLKGGVLYVFTSNAPPFEPDTAYSPFAAITLLDHGGDFAASALALRERGFGGDPTPVLLADLSGIVAEREPQRERPPDPGPIPAGLLRIPGFVSEVMDHCLATAPYPNQALAFCGALALQAFLAGRKVRDPGDNRTNLYLLGLAHSSAGKDSPRKLNARIAHAAGLTRCLGERLASGEGLQDALFVEPCMLVQTDEIDGMLQSINRAKDARHESIMGSLLTIYSAANGIYPMRRKAGCPDPGVIDQPCLVLLGTAIPNHWYEALSARMLTNGFFARMLIIESGPRAAGQEPSIAEPPPRIVATARAWAQMQPGPGNLAGSHPVPRTVAHSDEARRLLVGMREEAELEYSRCEASQDAVGTTVWGRVSEQVRKLALIHAVSESAQAPEIGADAVRWATALVMHQTRRMLFMAAGHVADNPFDAACLKVIERLRSAPDRTLGHSVLLKRMKVDVKTFREIVETLVQRGEVRVEPVATAGRTGFVYRLVGDAAVKEGEGR
jgi:hypothetical protein